jgi:CRISPR-associated protein Cmr4
MMKAKLLFLQALSPLHAGTGQGVGAIDLPIAREKATGIPIVPGSTVKGVLRTNCEADNDLKVRIFGPETDNASDHAGSAQFSDLRLLFLPVRSLSGTFAWVTSPLLLRRFQRDCVMTNTPFPAQVPSVRDKSECLVSSTNSKLTLVIEAQENQVVLEDLRFAGQTDTSLNALLDWLKAFLFGTDASWQTSFTERVCVVHDDVLSFLLDTATEITARIRLDEKRKTVEQGALWYEEALPAESILSGMVVIQEIKASERDVLDVITKLAQTPLQVGGSATLGRGLCHIHLVP